MMLRVTDERGFSHEFPADSPEDVKRGIRAGWDIWISALSGSRDASHPAFALVTRLAEIRSWLAPRMARADATEEQRKSWEAQASHWTYLANRDLGGAARLSPLRLHVLADSETWCTPAQRASPDADWRCNPVSPQVLRSESDERCGELFAGCVRMVEYDRELMGFADHVGDVVRQAQHPKPTLVRSDS